MKKYIIKKIDYKDLRNIIYDNLQKKYIDDKLSIDLKNTILIINYMAKNYTNLGDYYNLDINSFNELIESRDFKLKITLNKLKKILIKEIKSIKKDFERQFTEIDKKLNKIESLLLRG